MSILETFREHRATVTEQWVNAVFGSYALDTVGFLRTRTDQFCNPVGEITLTVAGYLFDAVAGEHMIEEKLDEALQRFVRLRSVQDFPPSQGIGVLYVLKQIFRDTFLEQMEKTGQMAAYLEAESRLDTLALMAFDMYIASRETLAEQRISEIRTQHSQLVRWAQSRGHSLDSVCQATDNTDTA